MRYDCLRKCVIAFIRKTILAYIHLAFASVSIDRVYCCAGLLDLSRTLSSLGEARTVEARAMYPRAIEGDNHFLILHL